MTDRHNVPMEESAPPGKRSGAGADSVLPHLQQQVQAQVPPDMMPEDKKARALERLKAAVNKAGEGSER
jgi:hypothetical protein